jgi:hypothetical protein
MNLTIKAWAMFSFHVLRTRTGQVPLPHLSEDEKESMKKIAWAV